jgi:predicted RNase H-like HicB family nuclease
MKRLVTKGGGGTETNNTRHTNDGYRGGGSGMASRQRAGREATQRGEQEPAVLVAAPEAAEAPWARREVEDVAEAAGRRRLRELRLKVEDLQSQVDQLHSSLHRMFADLDVRIVSGYLVKAWPDVETGEWVADCPRVGAAVQEESCEEAVQAIAAMIAEVLRVRAEFGDPIPPRDV